MRPILQLLVSSLFILSPVLELQGQEDKQLPSPPLPHPERGTVAGVGQKKHQSMKQERRQAEHQDNLSQAAALPGDRLGRSGEVENFIVEESQGKGLQESDAQTRQGGFEDQESQSKGGKGGQDKQERDAARTGDLLGLGSENFKDMIRKIDGVQPGFYIIGGQANVGKTAFMSSLFMDLIDANGHTRGVYFTLDDSKNTIVNRLLSIKSGLPINRVQRLVVDDNQKSIDTAYCDLTTLAKEGRLDILDQGDIPNVTALNLEIRREAQEPGLFVCIDGLYNLDLDTHHRDLRAENIDRANQIKGIVDRHEIPIIVTGELRKQQTGAKRDPVIDDLMETGKFAYNANVVWLLYPASDSFENQDKPVIILQYAKNKLSDFRGKIDLVFHRKLGRIVVDPPEQQTPSTADQLDAHAGRAR